MIILDLKDSNLYKNPFNNKNSKEKSLNLKLRAKKNNRKEEEKERRRKNLEWVNPKFRKCDYSL